MLGGILIFMFAFFRDRGEPSPQSSVKSAESSPPEQSSEALYPKPSILAKSAEDSKAPTIPSPAPSPPADNFASVLKTCWPDLANKKISQVEELIRHQSQNLQTKSEVIDIENYNIILPDGSERRIHLIPLAMEARTKPSGKSPRELRYFKVDAEGFPEAIALTRAQSSNPDLRFIQKLLDQGKVSLHQVKSTRRWSDESTLLLETRNGQVYEFQLRRKNQTLSCRNSSCSCLRS